MTAKARIRKLELALLPTVADVRIDHRPERVRFVGECMAGLHLDVFSLERIKEAKAMLESKL